MQRSHLDTYTWDYFVVNNVSRKRFIEKGEKRTA